MLLKRKGTYYSFHFPVLSWNLPSRRTAFIKSTTDLSDWATRDFGGFDVISACSELRASYPRVARRWDICHEFNDLLSYKLFCSRMRSYPSISIVKDARGR